MRLRLAFAIRAIGVAWLTLAGVMAAAQGVGPSQVRLDRAGMRATFVEDFAHFAASASGVVDGHPAWRTTFFGGDRTLPNNHEAEWYADPGPDGPFRVSNGILQITATPVAGLPRGAAYRSGLITSQRLFSQRYGYFEMRAQLPRGRGMWPAFWLLPADGNWPPEIDVMEMLGDAPTTYYVSLHARPGGKPLDAITRVHAPDLSAGFHVFGVAWRPDRIRFYLDDAMVHESETPADMHSPMYLLANLAVGGEGSWPGAPTAGLTGVYRIAWIRAWQFDDLVDAGGADTRR
jgi:beta-glucanase (GH16 family)